MLTGDLEHRILVGERTMPDATERDQLIDGVIEVFTRGYAA
ncbi:MAG: hypothetical protein QOJ04_5614, partial [Caballeronia sp.]|nr:hypothetical protein [Caballeronia sp.]